jgi:hypothetical protein
MRHPRRRPPGRRSDAPAPAPAARPMLLLPLDQVMQRAAALAAAMDAAGPIRINGLKVLAPRERLREAFGLQLETLLGGLARRVASRVGGGELLTAGRSCCCACRCCRWAPGCAPRPPTLSPPASAPLPLPAQDDSKGPHDVLPPLSVLAAEVQDFLSVAQSLQASLSFDIMPTLHQVG